MDQTMQKTEVQGIYKVSEGILINKDNDALKAYKVRKEKDRKTVSIEKDVEMLKTSMEEIKDLLMKVLAK
jgi:hypothetical protein